MVLDLIVIGIVGFFAIIGALTGALKQLIHFIGILAGWAAARFLGFSLGPVLAEAIGVPPMLGVGLAVLGLGFGVFLVVHLGGRLLLKAWRGEEGPGPADRGMGVLLGAAKSGAIVWLILSVLVFFDRPLQGIGWKFDLSGSETASLARSYNLLAHTGLPMDDLEALLERATGAASGKPDPELEAASRDPRVRRLAGDASVRKALREGDYVTVLRRADVIELLGDSKLRGALLRAGATRTEKPPEKAPAGK